MTYEKFTAQPHDDTCECCKKARNSIRHVTRQQRHIEECLQRKNKELDALLMVWCTGCEAGMQRFSEKTEVTPEMVDFIERYAKRIRTWYNNKQYREARKRDLPKP